MNKSDKPTPRLTIAQQQQVMLAESRAQSILDSRIPLAIPAVGPRPEVGKTSMEYFAAKHARGPVGTYYPLHEVALMRH